MSVDDHDILKLCMLCAFEVLEFMLELGIVIVKSYKERCIEFPEIDDLMSVV